MGGDVRDFHPPAGRFDGIIGGDPCQSHSSLANLVRAKGLEPSFPDLGPEYERVVNEARPAWFLRENVPGAPDIKPDGYDVRTFMLDNSTLDSGDGWGNEQMRKRRFWFGVRDGAAPELRQWIQFALHELPTVTQAVAADHRAVPVAIGGSGKRKVTAVGGHDGTADALGDKAYRESRRVKVLTVGGDHGTPMQGRKRRGKAAPPPSRSLEEMMRLQGIPPDWFEHSPFTMQGKRKIVGNAVSVHLGRALAGAIRKWIDDKDMRDV